MRNKPVQDSAPHTIEFITMTLFFAVLFFLTACATPPPPGKASSSSAFEEGVPGGVIVNTVDVSAKVTALDRGNRKVTLLGPDGKKFKVKVGPEAANFDQVRIGDMVKATLTEELVIYLDKEGASAPDGGAGVVALAPKGAKPGGLVIKTVKVTATVTAIDQANRKATLRFENGRVKTFPVRPDIDLSQHKAGEKVVFLVTEMIAISIEKPKQ